MNVRVKVVNCFQISTLLVKSQLTTTLSKVDPSCELLSNQYFTSEITARYIEKHGLVKL